MCVCVGLTSSEVLDLAPSPVDARVVACLTDRDRIFIYTVRAGAASLVATLVVQNDSFAQARLAWSAGGRYLYSTCSVRFDCLRASPRADLSVQGGQSLCPLRVAGRHALPCGEAAAS